MSAPDPRKRAMASFCVVCRTPSGPDCPDKAIDGRSASKRDRAQVRKGSLTLLKTLRSAQPHSIAYEI